MSLGNVLFKRGIICVNGIFPFGLGCTKAHFKDAKAGK